MKSASNNLDTFILLKIKSSTHIPCVHLGRFCECCYVQSSSQGITELLYCMPESEPAVGIIKMTKI